jgi:hypothetical protein
MRKRAQNGAPARRVSATLALALVFLSLALWLSAPTFDGEFLSDDYIYIVNNAYVHGLSWENVRVLLDPWGPPTVYTLNYAPVHLILHAAEWHVFGSEAMRGWHVVNAVAHAAVSLLLVALFARSGLPRTAAVFGAAFFLVHPANVETVCWIFQLKTIVALGLSVAALLLHERRPGWAALLFALAVLTKITAIAVLPAAAVQAWIRSRNDGTPTNWAWLGVWLAFLAVVSVPEFTAFQRQADTRIVIHEDMLVHARTVVAIAGRYLAMAATGWGVSTFHEPEPAMSLADPWWLAGLVALGALAARGVWALRNRREEAVYWVLAAAGFAPVSQIFPFIFPMGDRYLYPILPGLIGGVFLALRPAAAWLWQRAAIWGGNDGRRAAVALGAGLVILVLATTSRERAPVFASHDAMSMDAALNYPDGLQAALLRARQAVRMGDAPAAAAAYRRAVELGYSDLASLTGNPALARVSGHPDFQAMLRDFADRDIARLSRHEHPEQSELMRLALAHVVRDEPATALELLERALELEGPFAEEIREQIRVLRALHPDAVSEEGAEPG